MNTEEFMARCRERPRMVLVALVCKYGPFELDDSDFPNPVDAPDEGPELRSILVGGEDSVILRVETDEEREKSGLFSPAEQKVAKAPTLTP